jgi:hypothetical protein
MIGLNAKGMAAFRKLVAEGTQPCPLYAVEVDTGAIIVTNQSILLEFPADQVEDCSQLHKLLASQKHELAKNVGNRLQDGEWRTTLFPAGGEIVEDAEEVDLTDEEREEDSDRFVYAWGKERIYYHWSNFEIAESFVEDPVYQMFVGPEGHSPLMRLMVVFEDEHIVGVFTNNGQNDADEGEDDE